MTQLFNSAVDMAAPYIDATDSEEGTLGSLVAACSDLLFHSTASEQLRYASCVYVCVCVCVSARVCVYLCVADLMATFVLAVQSGPQVHRAWQDGLPDH